MLTARNSRAPARATFTPERLAEERANIARRHGDVARRLVVAYLDPERPLPQKEEQASLNKDPIGCRLTALAIAQDFGLDLPDADVHHNELLRLIDIRHNEVEDTIQGKRAGTDDPFTRIQGMSDRRWLVDLRNNLADTRRAITDALQHGRPINLAPLALGSINHARELAQKWTTRQATAEHVEELVDAGEVTLARQLASDIGSHDMDFTDDDGRKLRDLAAAAKTIGHTLDHLSLLGDASSLRKAHGYATAPSRLDAFPDRERTSAVRMTHAADPATALTRLHAVLRDPQRFLTEERPVNHELAVRVEMTADAYRNMYADLRESAAWSHERVIVDRDSSDAHGSRGGYLIGVATRMRARVGQTTVSIDMVSHLAADPETSRLSGVNLAREAFGDAYASGLRPPEGITDQGPVSWQPAEHAAAPTFPSTHHLLGPDRCDHPDATWRLHNNRYSPYLALECLRCLRRRIAIRPALLDITTAEGRKRFRNQQVAQQILTGAPRNDDVDALIEAARALPTDPAAYATHIDAAEPKPPARDRRRPRSIADAMRRT